MAKLILLLDDRVVNEFPVDAPVTIGRQSDNAVVIDNAAVSSHHACVYRDDDHFVVEDLQSTNGTFVNGTRISRRNLRPANVDAAQLRAMFETSADVLGGLIKAFSDYEKKNESAWRKAS